jgi:hypothetical protein
MNGDIVVLNSKLNVNTILSSLEDQIRQVKQLRTKHGGANMIGENEIVEIKVLVRTMKDVSSSMKGSSLQHEYIEKCMNRILTHLD